MKKKVLIIIGVIILIFLLIFGVLYIIDTNTTKNNQTNGSSLENNIKGEENRIEDVTMFIKDNTLTNNGATIIVKNNTDKQYSYDEWYQIDKKEDGKWKALEIVNENHITNLLAHILEKNSQNEEKINWSMLYGKLENGEYRLRKEFHSEGEHRNFFVKFSI